MKGKCTNMTMQKVKRSDYFDPTDVIFFFGYLFLFFFERINELLIPSGRYSVGTGSVFGWQWVGHHPYKKKEAISLLYKTKPPRSLLTIGFCPSGALVHILRFTSFALRGVGATVQARLSYRYCSHTNTHRPCTDALFGYIFFARFVRKRSLILFLWSGCSAKGQHTISYLWITTVGKSVRIPNAQKKQQKMSTTTTIYTFRCCWLASG